VKYVFTASSLHPTSPASQICKCADDTYLLVVPATTHYQYLKRSQTRLWTTANSLKLNNNESQEMIVYLPRRRQHFPTRPAVPGIRRLDKMNILGITVSDTLTFYHHITAFVAKSAGSFYALKTILARSLDTKALWGVLPWSHNSCMQALLGGGIWKPTKGTGSNQLWRRPNGMVISTVPSALWTNLQRMPLK